MSGKRQIGVYYCDIPNFGDQLNRDLLRGYGWDPVFAPAPEAEIGAIGSILEHLGESFRGIILGSGFIAPGSTFSFLDASIPLVRGKLSRQRIERFNLGTGLGDLGLLISRLFPKKPAACRLGIVPHYVDADSPSLKGIAALGEAVRIIDPTRSPEAVAGEISRCEHVLSSSLHGLITAHAYGLPAGWIELGDRVTGGRYKFDDYHSAFGVRVDPVSLAEADSIDELTGRIPGPPPGLEHKISELDQLMRGLEGLLKKQHRYKHTRWRRASTRTCRRSQRKLLSWKNRLTCGRNSLNR